MPPPPPKPKGAKGKKEAKDTSGETKEREWVKGTGDGHTDVAEPEVIKIVLTEPAENDGHINVAVRVRSGDKLLSKRLFFQAAHGALRQGHHTISVSPTPCLVFFRFLPFQIRPPNQRELDGGARNIIVHAESETSVRLDPPSGDAQPSRFVYDFAIGADSTQVSRVPRSAALHFFLALLFLKHTTLCLLNILTNSRLHVARWGSSARSVCPWCKTPSMASTRRFVPPPPLIWKAGHTRAS